MIWRCLTDFKLLCNNDKPCYSFESLIHPQNVEKGAITVNSENSAFHSLGCNCAILSLLYTQNSINSSANFKRRYYRN